MTQPPDNSPDSFISENVEWTRSIAYDLVRDHARADDLAQNLWMEVLSKRPDDVRSPRAWIRGALRNLGLAGRRKSMARTKHETAAAAEMPTEFTPSDVEEARDLVQWALPRVKSPYRETLELSYLQGLDNSVIAQQLGISVDTVRSRVSRGLSQMREELRKKGLGEGTPWAILLLPLLATARGMSPTRTTSLSDEKDGVSAKSTIIIAPSRIKKRLFAGLVAAAALVLLLRLPTLLESSPPKLPASKSPAETIVAEIPPQVRPEVALLPEKTDQPAKVIAAQPSVTERATKSDHKLFIVIDVLDAGVKTDVALNVDASPEGPIALSLPSRRPVRMTPDERIPFVKVATSIGRSGQPIVIDVPTNEAYMLRIGCESAKNVVYVRHLPGMDGKSTIHLARKLRLRIPRLSFDTAVTIRADRLTSDRSFLMTTPDDDDDDVRVAKGPFLLPAHVDVEIEGLGALATAEVKSADSVLNLPPLIKTPCRIRSLADEKLVDRLTTRSVVYGSDGTLWSIVTTPTTLGHCDIVTPTLVNSSAPHFAQFRAEGFDTTTIDGPASTRSLREQDPKIDKSRPFDVFVAPVGFRGGGRILNADGVAVRRGTVFLLAEGLSAFVGCVDADGRFLWEPLMKTTAYLNSDYEYRPGILSSSTTASLLYEDDEEFSMVHLADVRIDELVRGEWIGRLPGGPGPRIRFVDQTTRRSLTPSRVFYRPLSKDEKPLGTPLFEEFYFGKRSPRGGKWRVNAVSPQYKPIVATIDAEREDVEIEMIPEAHVLTTITIRCDGQPVAGLEVTLFRDDGVLISGGILRTDSSGAVYLTGGEAGAKVRCKINHATHKHSVGSSLVVEAGKSHMIDLLPMVSVPIRASDLSGRPIENIAVAACDASGRRIHEELLVPKKGSIKLTREPQTLVVLAASHRPQTVTWSPSPEGPIESVLVTLSDGCRVEMTIGESDPAEEAKDANLSTIEQTHMANLSLIRPFVDTIREVIPPPSWPLRLQRDLQNPMKHSVVLAPGRYRLQFGYRGKSVWDKEFDVQGDMDWGMIELKR